MAVERCQRRLRTALKPSRPTDWLRFSIIALLILTLSGCAHWRRFAAPQGIAFNAPADLKAESALVCGNSGFLAAYRAPGCYFGISWMSYDAVSSAKELAELAAGPKHTVEIGEDYNESYPYGAALHIEWIRPNATIPPPNWPRDSLRARTPGRHDTLRVALPVWYGDGRYRVLHLSGGCRTRHERDVLLEVFRSVRFVPW